MRHVIAFLLSVLLTLNAAYAAVHGACDAMEQLADHGAVMEHGAHFGHHGHEHDHDDAASSTDDDNTKKDQSQAHSAHCHVHAPFTSLIPSGLAVPVLPDNNSPATLVAETLVSTAASRLERPPRAFHA